MDMTSDLSLQESCMAALRHMGVEVTALVGKTNELEAENAKLRKLVRELYDDQCDKCDQWKYRDRMRELGIEVEE